MERKAKGIWIPIEVWEDKNLSWNEKILFLEIDSYTSKDSDCYISNEYISKLLGVTETSANKILASLISKGYVVKTKFDGRKRYIKTNMVYRKSALTYEESQPCRLEQPCIAAESNILIQSTNTDTNHKEEIDKSISKKDDYLPFAAEPQQEYGDKPKKKRNAMPKDDPLFEECWKAYNRRGNKEKAKVYWDKICEEERNNILPHIKAYVQSRDRQYQSYFERYLRDKSFNDVVYKGNSVLYDPDIANDNEGYHPATNGTTFVWNETLNCYMYVGNINDFFDGYTNENRPNGAQFKSFGYTYIWNSTTKSWDKE